METTTHTKCQQLVWLGGAFQKYESVIGPFRFQLHHQHTRFAASGTCPVALDKLAQQKFRSPFSPWSPDCSVDKLWRYKLLYFTTTPDRLSTWKTWAKSFKFIFVQVYPRPGSLWSLVKKQIHGFNDTVGDHGDNYTHQMTTTCNLWLGCAFQGINMLYGLLGSKLTINMNDLLRLAHFPWLWISWHNRKSEALFPLDLLIAVWINSEHTDIYHNTWPTF